MEHLKALQKQVDEIEERIVAWHKGSDLSRRLVEVPGIGPITASAIAATVGDAKSFDNGRQLAAWMGLVPRQDSSGGKNVLLGIGKRGDTYLRTLLIHGARAVIYASQRKKGQMNSWLAGLLERRNSNVAAVALANKNARIIWAMLRNDRKFQIGYSSKTIAA